METARARVRLGLLALAGLLLLTGAFGRTFSKLEVGFSWLHPTEIVLALVLVATLLDPSPRQWWRRLRDTRAVVPLVVLWLLAAVALLRGLVDWGFERVLHDVGLIEYSVLVPLIVATVRDRYELVWMCRVIAIAGLLATAAFFLGYWIPSEWDLSPGLSLIPAASGMYALLCAAWITARMAAGVEVAPWKYAAIPGVVALLILASVRSTWIALLVTLVGVCLLASRGRRLLVATRLLALVLAGTCLSLLAERADVLPLPTPAQAAAYLQHSLPVVEADGPAAVPGTAGERAAVGSPGPTPISASVEGAGDAHGSGGQPHELKARPHSLSTNPGFEFERAGGYTSFGANTAVISSRRAAAGEQSLRATYGDDLRLVQAVTLPLPSPERHSISAWVFVPPSWNGGPLALSTDGTWAGAAENTQGSVAKTKGAWTRVRTVVNPDGSDLTGGIHVRALSAPTAGKAVYVDNLTIRPATGTHHPSGAIPARPEPEATGLGEVTASFRETSQRANALWRLAFWEFMVSESARQPLLGAGFGKPSNFVWRGVHYDRRTGDSDDPFDVSGPHNSFVNILYRTGILGLLAVVAMMLLAVGRLLPIARAARGHDRALAVWLLAAIAITTVTASFNVALEGPFMGIFFWAVLGLALVAPAVLKGDPSSEPDISRATWRSLPGR